MMEQIPIPYMRGMHGIKNILIDFENKILCPKEIQNGKSSQYCLKCAKHSEDTGTIKPSCEYFKGFVCTTYQGDYVRCSCKEKITLKERINKILNSFLIPPDMIIEYKDMVEKIMKVIEMEKKNE